VCVIQFQVLPTDELWWWLRNEFACFDSFVYSKETSGIWCGVIPGGGGSKEMALRFYFIQK
jgi:hypothetical protein